MERKEGDEVYYEPDRGDDYGESDERTCVIRNLMLDTKKEEKIQ